MNIVVIGDIYDGCAHTCNILRPMTNRTIAFVHYFHPITNHFDIDKYHLVNDIL